MKKILTILVLILFIASGCKNNNKPEEKTLEETLTDQLREYSYNIFNDIWTSGGVKEGTYIVTLKDMKENLNYDISMFKNENDEECNSEETKIEFIVSKQIVPDKTNYEMKYYVVCD